MGSEDGTPDVQQQASALAELRDMEFEVIGRLESERVLREKQLQLMSEHAEKLDKHSSMLEKVFAGQRALNHAMQKVSSQQDRVLGSAHSPTPAPPSTAAVGSEVESPVVLEALKRFEVKVEAKLELVQKNVERAIAESVTPPEPPEEGMLEFAGLWFENRAKHVISGRYLRDTVGMKIELEVLNHREFNVPGESLGKGCLSPSGQELVWSSGRVWTRSPGKRTSQAPQEPSPKPQQQLGRGSSMEVAGKTSTENTGMTVAYSMPWSKHATIPEELIDFRSILGDSLRDHATQLDEKSRRRGCLIRLADFADWVEAQKRAPREDESPGKIDRVVQSLYFECVSALLILANAVYIGYTTNWFMQHPQEETPGTMVLVDVLFLLLFTAELLLRACSLGRRFLFGADAVWYYLDMFLIAISAGELLAGSSGTFSFLRTLRVFKLARVIRMVRTLRLFGELRLLLDCMMGSLNSLFWCLLVIAFVFYLFALILVQGLATVVGDIEKELEMEQQAAVGRRLLGGWVPGRQLSAYAEFRLEGEDLANYIKDRYGSVSVTMLRLWEATTGGVDWEVEYNVVSSGGFLLSAVFLGFIAFMFIVVWNIVTSTIVEKALRFAQPDIDQLLMDKRRRDNEDVELLLTMLEKAGIEVTRKITEEEFLTLVSQKDMGEFLQVRGIDIKEAHTFFALLNEDASSEGVDTTNFIIMCLRIKGFATSIDLHTIHYQLMGVLRRQARLLNDLLKNFSRFQNAHLSPARQEDDYDYETSEVLSTVIGAVPGRGSARGGGAAAAAAAAAAIS